VPASAPILEINPQHPLVARLRGADDAWTGEWAHLLHDEALLAEGGRPEDPAAFVRRINTLLLDRAQTPRSEA
jgi:molecular chaperone HtpG